RFLGRRVLVFDQLGSTNTRALELSGDPSLNGLAILADEQLAGRGQQGRSWLAPPGSSVLLTVLLFPPPALDRPVLLTAWAALAVCRLVGELTHIRPRIKWPNDVLVGGRKLCGILIEQNRVGPIPATVAGIGLNVRQSAEDLLAAGLQEATSLAVLGCSEDDTHAIARRLLHHLDAIYADMLDGQRKPLEREWAELLAWLEQPVCLEGPRQKAEGVLIACEFGRLVLEQSDGTILEIAPEMVTHIRPGSTSRDDR
ncbi:MAG: biotin--[acetyl-CoA-carboxylase] ligase, partial [Gemmataceae bacterium]